MTTAITPATPLWALAPQYAAVIAELLEAEGEVTDEELAERFKAIGDAFDIKIEKLQMVYRHISGDAAAARAFVEAAMKPYVERAQQLERAAERVKKIAYDGLIAAGVDRVETPLGGARLQKNPKDTVTFEGDPRTLPLALQRITVEIDREAAIAAKAKGEPVPDSVDVKRNRHLRWI